jgi:hypothetical protein
MKLLLLLLLLLLLKALCLMSMMNEGCLCSFLQARKSILHIHTSQWSDPPSGALLSELATMTVGYCGADLKALCTEASLAALRRR